MPRVRSDDYETKSQAIMDCAAALFAKEGYPSAKMQDIAKACGATKSMLYHYYPTKDDLLYAMLLEHLERVLAGIEEALATPGTPKERLRAMVEVYTQKSAQSRRRHIIAMQDVKYLPRPRQMPLIALQRALTERVAQLLREVNPGLPEHVYKPYTLMLLGMLNWADTWYKPSGPMKPQELCDRLSRLFLRGFLAEKP
ncbi:TetR/AcrR family transcriptional regulator [Variovorax guangxiensis]|uniref:TetR/AcrR family transcriptional regulator n=1 Tax=Variovorax guangxiensis TaxID=1775474 RepID=UPI00285CD9D1|nr:TetR/AcrR family transcriptional regulator [Variovorax guangxiensis]MDR6861101.1 AcrR family transcriptional regulator [Variovorax guangxiensis]